MNRSRITGDLVSQNNIFVDIANDRVGIGTTIPTDKVDLNGDLKLHDAWGYGNHIKFHHSKNTLNFPSASLSNIARLPKLSFGDRTSTSQLGVGDFLMYHDFYNMHMKYYGAAGNLVFSNNNTEIHISGANGSGNSQASIRIPAGATAGVKLYQAGAVRFETVGYGVTVHGTTETQELNVTGVTTTTDDINLPNDKKVNFGSFGFQMYQNTSPSNNAIIQQSAAGQFLRLITNGGSLNLEADYVQFRNSANSTTTAQFDADGKTSLYHNSNLKFTTESYGVNVTGNFVADCSVTIDPDSYTNHFITGNIADGSGWGAYGIAFGQGTGKMAAFGVSNSLYMAHGDGSNANSLTTFMEVSNAGRVKINYNGSTKIETKSSGINVLGHVHATSTGSQIASGDTSTNNYLLFYHDGSNGFIQNGTGGLTIKDVSGGNIEIQATSGETSIFCGNNGSVQLYNDNVKKFETTAYGTNITGTTDTDGLVVSGITTATGKLIALDTITTGKGSAHSGNAQLWVERDGINLSTEYSAEDQNTNAHICLAGENSHVRLQMGTEDVSPFSGWIQASFDNTPDSGGTGSSGTSGLKLNPQGGTVSTGAGLNVAGNITGGGLTILDQQPKIYLTDNTGSPNDPDYLIQVDGGSFLIYDVTNTTNKILINADGHIDILPNTDFGAGIDVTGDSTFANNVSVTGQLSVGQLASPTKIQAGNPTIRFVQQNNSLSNRGYIEFYYNTSNLSARISGKARNSANGQIYFDVEKDSTLTNILLVDDAGVDITGNITGTGNLTLTSTDAGSSAAPEINLFRNSASPADADYLGQIKFQGESDTGVQRNYAKITGKILDASNGTEDGILEFAHIKAGSQTITGRWRSDSLQLLNDTNLSVDGIGVFGRNALDPDSYGTSSGGFGGISDGSGWSAMGVFVHGGGTGDAAAMAHNGSKLYFGIQNGSGASSMETWLDVTPGTRVINFQTDNNSTNFQCGGNVIWHAGNDGAGSTLDADLLDGVQGSGYVRTILDDHDITARMNSGFYETNTATTAEGWPETTNSDFHLIAATHTNTANYFSMQLAGSMHHQDKFYIRTTSNSGTRAWSKIWTSSSDGSGSGLDADTVDGIQASSFLNIGADNAVTNYNHRTQWYSNSAINSGSSQQASLECFQANSGGDAFMAFHVNGDFAAYFGLDGGTNDFAVGGWSMGANSYKVWHQGNDGTGSGLDADTLDGVQGASFLRLDADNSVTSYQNKTTWPSSTSIGTGSGHQASLEVYQGTSDADAFMAFHVAGDYAAYFGLDGGTNDFAVGGWSMGAVSNRVWHAGNDGSGSGLDADTVDGVHASSFCRTDTTFTFNGSGNDINIDYDNNRNLVRIQRSGSERFMLGAAGNEIKINTSNGGFLTFGTSLTPQSDNAYDLGSSSKRWANLYTADAHFNNIGTGGNDIDGTEGSWTLQEAEDNIYMINRKNGKRYKIKMEEV